MHLPRRKVGFLGHVGAGRKRFFCFALAVFRAVQHIPFGMQQDRVLPQRLLGVGDHRQRLIVDFDQG
ncbi:hypothetical protein D3C76_1172020 [compost metagenome]